MITFTHKGNFEKTDKFLKKINSKKLFSKLDKYGKEGVDALRNATPKDTGLTANSWTYKVSVSSNVCSITWSNSNMNKGVPIALVLQYGHVTGTGGYVQGIDYINPAMKPIFDKILFDVWKEVSS